MPPSIGGPKETSTLYHRRLGAGKEILYLHGWGCSNEVFALEDSLSFCSTAPDLYGFGATPPPPMAVGLDYYADGVMELMAHYHMEDAVLVGHSFGARVAIRVAAHSDRVAGLVLVGAAGLRPRRGVRYAVRVLRAKCCRLLGRPYLGGSADYRSLTGPMRRTFIRIVHTYQEREVRALRCPVLLVWGTEDTQTPLYMLHRFQRLLPHARTVLMEGCDHYCFLQQPARFRALVQQFAASLC